MSFFGGAPPTNYDLNFKIGDIPVRVHPLFWLVTLLLGANSGLAGILIWVVVVFFSILVHELGHVLAMRMYGQDGSILLHAGGGLAIPTSYGWGRGRGGLTRQEQIIVSLAGPLAGFMVAAVVLGIVYLVGGVILMDWLLFIIPLPQAFLPTAGFVVNVFIQMMLWVNIFWGLINLLPIYPLDGGQVARQLFAGADPWDGVRKSLILSLVAAGVMALVGLVYLGSVYMALLFGFLAFQSYQSLYGRF